MKKIKDITNCNVGNFVVEIWESIKDSVRSSRGESVFDSIRHVVCTPMRNCVGPVRNPVILKSREFTNENN